MLAALDHTHYCQQGNHASLYAYFQLKSIEV
jgi:hypothetical protein